MNIPTETRLCMGTFSLRSAEDAEDLAHESHFGEMATRTVLAAGTTDIDVFYMRHSDGLTYREIGARLGMSRERTRQLLEQIHGKLRRFHDKDESPSGGAERAERRAERELEWQRWLDDEKRAREEQRRREEEIKLARNQLHRRIHEEDPEVRRRDKANYIMDEIDEDLMAAVYRMQHIVAKIGDEDRKNLSAFYSAMREAQGCLARLDNGNRNEIRAIVDRWVREAEAP